MAGKYASLAEGLGRLQGEVATLQARMRTVEELNAAATNLAVVFGTLFSSVPGVEAWGARGEAKTKAAAGGGADAEGEGGEDDEDVAMDG